MELTRAEQETIITTNEEEKFWDIYTASRFMMIKLDKLIKAKEIMKDGDKVYAKRYEVPEDWVVVKRPAVQKLTDEQRKQRREWMGQINEQRKRDKMPTLPLQTRQFNV